MVGQPLIFLLEDTGILAFNGMTVRVVFAILLNGIDKDQAQDLDPLRTQSFFLVQVLLDSTANHFPLYGQRIHIAVRFPDTKEVLAPGHAQFQELVALLDPDFTHAAIFVDGAVRGLFQVVAVLVTHFLAPDTRGCLHVQLDFGRDDSALVAH